MSSRTRLLWSGFGVSSKVFYSSSWMRNCATERDFYTTYRYRYTAVINLMENLRVPGYCTVLRVAS